MYKLYSQVALDLNRISLEVLKTTSRTKLFLALRNSFQCSFARLRVDPIDGRINLWVTGFRSPAQLSNKLKHD